MHYLYEVVLAFWYGPYDLEGFRANRLFEVENVWDECNEPLFITFLRADTPHRAVRLPPMARTV